MPSPMAICSVLLYSRGCWHRICRTFVFWYLSSCSQAYGSVALPEARLRRASLLRHAAFGTETIVAKHMKGSSCITFSK